MNLNKYSKETLIRFIESQPRLGDITPLLDMFEEAVQMERLLGQAKNILNEVETIPKENFSQWTRLSERVAKVQKQIEALLVTTPKDLTRKK